MRGMGGWVGGFREAWGDGVGMLVGISIDAHLFSSSVMLFG